MALSLLTPNLMGIAELSAHNRATPICGVSSLDTSASASARTGAVLCIKEGQTRTERCRSNGACYVAVLFASHHIRSHASEPETQGRRACIRQSVRTERRLSASGSRQHRPSTDIASRAWAGRGPSCRGLLGLLTEPRPRLPCRETSIGAIARQKRAAFDRRSA